MMIESEVQKRGDVLPGLIESLGALARNSSATILNRFQAVDLLMRLAIGPRARPADNADLAASRCARIALSDAASFLEQAMTSTEHRARVRLHAACLARLIGRILSCSPELAGLSFEFRAIIKGPHQDGAEKRTYL